VKVAGLTHAYSMHPNTGTKTTTKPKYKVISFMVYRLMCACRYTCVSDFWLVLMYPVRVRILLMTRIRWPMWRCDVPFFQWLARTGRRSYTCISQTCINPLADGLFYSQRYSIFKGRCEVSCSKRLRNNTVQQHKENVAIALTQKARLHEKAF
jgi:hypothetical protein